MFNNLLSVLRFSLGLILLMLGIVGLVIPILQGTILIFLAIPLLSPYHGKRLIDWIKSKFKKRFPSSQKH